MSDRRRAIEERLQQILGSDAAALPPALSVHSRDGVTIVGGVVNIGGEFTRALAARHADELRDVEWRRSVYREVRIRLSGHPVIRQSFGLWLSSVHKAKDITELDDETLAEALAWVRKRTAE